MLLSFRVSNHRSLRDEQELDLRPVYDRSRPAVPVAAIYGANASGKTNVVDALRRMRAVVLDSFAKWDMLGGVLREPFILDPAARSAESRFGVDLLLSDERYVYGFAIDDKRVTEEWMHHYPRGRRRILFERDVKGIRFGESLRGPKSTVEDVTRPNSLFLSAAAHLDLEQLLPVFGWFKQCVHFAHSTDTEERHTLTIEALQGDPEKSRRLIELLRVADFGVQDIEIEDPPDFTEAFEAFMAGWENSGVTEDLSDLDVARLRERLVSLLGAQLSPSRYSHRVRLVHEATDGAVPLALNRESHGTQTWFDFLGTLVSVLDDECLLAVDELDASLHPLLVREFVRLFQNEPTNPNGAQLVFTSHDTSLLAPHHGEELLHRDEIWFTEKARFGATSLYPLTDFKPRQGLNWERRYLGGAVGAVPFLDEEAFEEPLRSNRGDS